MTDPRFDGGSSGRVSWGMQCGRRGGRLFLTVVVFPGRSRLRARSMPGVDVAELELLVGREVGHLSARLGSDPRKKLVIERPDVVGSAMKAS